MQWLWPIRDREWLMIKQELAFEPFYRVTLGSHGAGLGLCLVKQIVTNHSGHVSLQSSLRGTKSTVQL